MRPDDEPPVGSVAAWSVGVPLVEGEAGLPETERYQRGGELGRGGMGLVDAAWDRWLGREVAVKRPQPGVGGERLAWEARVTARLVHPAIPPVFDVGEDERGAFYTMPVLCGATLHDRLRHGLPSLRVGVRAVARASRAAGYAHALGVVHRDLKPANLLMGEHDELWVLDWGLAREPGSVDVSPVGTPGFVAPEVSRGEGAGPASDVYSLGVTLSAVLDAWPGPCPELRAVVARATSDRPSDRYTDGVGLAEDLERWLDGHLVAAHRYPAAELVRHLVWRWRAPLAVLLVASGVAFALGVAALRAQRVERLRADGSLSLALAQQAESLRRVGARPEAEVLAAHALALGENPLARGVLMAFAASPSPWLRDERAPPCARPFLEPDGRVVCVGQSVRVFDARGREVVAIPLDVAPMEGESMGPVIDARSYPDGTVLVRRSTNHLQRWRDGTLATSSFPATSIGLADGPVPAVFNQRSVARLDGVALVWGPPTCERIEAAWVDADRTLIACRESSVFLGSATDPGEAVPVHGAPSAVTWADGVIVGTFDGILLSGDPSAWTVSAAGVGPIRQVRPLGRGRLGVLGERGDARIWSVPAREALAALPRGVGALALDAGDVVALGETWRRYGLPDDLGVGRFDRSEEGGISTFDVSPSGAWLVAGSGSGDVASWSMADGVVTRVAPRVDMAAKAVRFLDERRFVHSVGAGTLERGLGGGEPVLRSSLHVREALTCHGALALLPWAARVVLQDASERTLALPAAPIAVACGERLWVLDERGGVHELVGDALVARFTAPAVSGAFAATPGGFAFAEGADLVVRGVSGAPRWRFHGAAPVTAVVAWSGGLIAGDRDGRLRVLDGDGVLRAVVGGHDRRVSGLVVRGDRVFSGGWDGVLRLWGLGALSQSGPEALALVRARWGLSLEQALARAEGWPAG